MARAYVLIYSDMLGTREEVRDFIDGIPEITFWRYDLPNTFYLVSELSADELSDVVQGLNRKRARFLVIEVGSNKQGWLPRETWSVLNRYTGNGSRTVESSMAASPGSTRR